MGVNVAARMQAWVERRTLRRWSRLADRAGSPRTPRRPSASAPARALLQQRVDRLIHVADERLALPMVGARASRSRCTRTGLAARAMVGPGGGPYENARPL